ncbi:MAG TPA: SGNH/GDSL hydrolase family protein, partial [Candidatus Limnocylindrales bacterium]|nr:SGNH/GDSL hydrolase family protein [Candidatus Limnocylindrales bacterium]
MSVIKSVMRIGVVVLAGIILAQSVRLLMLKHDVSAYKKYWEQQATLPSQSNSLIYVALGDSAAQGIGASKPQNGYVGLLGNALSAQTGRPVRIVNLSVTGATVSDLIHNQLPMLRHMDLPPDSVVTVEIGANDMAKFNEIQFKGHIEQLFSQLPPHTVVADIPYFGGGRVKGREQNALLASDIIAEAAGRYRLRLAPLHTTTKAGDSIGTYGAD